MNSKTQKFRLFFFVYPGVLSDKNGNLLSRQNFSFIQIACVYILFESAHVYFYDRPKNISKIIRNLKNYFYLLPNNFLKNL